MAERTIRKRNGSTSTTVIGSGEPASIDAGIVKPIAEPVTIQSDGTVEPTTIDDYIVDESDSGNGNTFVDPNTGSSTDTGTRRRTRSDAGRPRGKRASRASATETSSSIASMLYTVHLGLGHVMGSDLIALTEEESKQYAKAVMNVSQLYDLPVIGEKALAWTNLAVVMGSIYGPRFITAKMRKLKKKPQPQVITFETVPKESQA